MDAVLRCFVRIATSKDKRNSIKNIGFKDYNGVLCVESKKRAYFDKNLSKILKKRCKKLNKI